jgi:GNAT superfamily N-acetyltransferase
MKVIADDPGLTLAVLPYPLSLPVQTELIQLLRTQWTRTDYDWLEAMHGDYSERLVITSVLARRDGQAIATATVHFARGRPEVAVLGGVLTHRDHRGHGLAGQVIEAALAVAREAGCRVCLLGTGRKPLNVYHQHGFAWLNGAVMRRSFIATDLEPDYFSPGQRAEVRPATWGDLGGLSLLLAQPLAMVGLDFPRGLFSGRYVPAERCLSNFPVLWSDTVARGGLLSVLTEPGTGRIFGHGSLTRAPGAARQHTATIDCSAHDHYLSHLPALLTQMLDGARTMALRHVEAHVAAGDDAKLAGLRSAGFQELIRLPGALRLERETRDILLLRLTL